MYLIVSRDKDNAMVRIHFPATPEEVQHGLSQFDGHGTSDGPVQIVGTSSYADRLENYIKYVDLNSEATIEKLNQLKDEMINSIGNGYMCSRELHTEDITLDGANTFVVCMLLTKKKESDIHAENL